jgi:hypothetical protein
LVIAALGAAACLGLTFGMQQLLDLHQERHRDPLALALEAQLADRRTGPVLVRRPTGSGGREMQIQCQVLAGLDKGRIADTLAAAVWQQTAAQEPLRELAIVVGDDDGGPPQEFLRSRPARRQR